MLGRGSALAVTVPVIENETLGKVLRLALTTVLKLALEIPDSEPGTDETPLLMAEPLGTAALEVMLTG